MIADFRAYRTRDRRVIDAHMEYRREQHAAHQATIEWQAKVSPLFRTIGAHPTRYAAVAVGLVIGIVPAADENAPEGWVLDETMSGAFVPDMTTDLGRRLQREIDELPGHPTKPDPREHGFPPVFTVSHSDHVHEWKPEAFVSEVAFCVAWPTRSEPAELDATMSVHGRAAGVVWDEMKRSEFLALVEQLEASVG